MSWSRTRHAHCALACAVLAAALLCAGVHADLSSEAHVASLQAEEEGNKAQVANNINVNIKAEAPAAEASTDNASAAPGPSKSKARATNSRRRLLRRARFREVLESRATDGQRGRLQTGWGRGRRRRRRRRWFKAAKRFVKKATRKVVKVAKKVHKHAKKAVKTVARHVKKSFHTLVNVGRIARCAASFKRCRRGFCPDRVCLPRNCKRIPGGKGYMIPRSWNRVKRFFPTCRRHNPCIPSWVRLPLKGIVRGAARRLVSTCRPPCRGGQLRKTLCIPDSLRDMLPQLQLQMHGINVKDVVPFCGNCQTICLPNSLKSFMDRKYSQYLRIGSCAAGCRKTPSAFCIPSHIRPLVNHLVRSGSPLLARLKRRLPVYIKGIPAAIRAMRSCSRCTRMCIPHVTIPNKGIAKKLRMFVGKCATCRSRKAPKSLCMPLDYQPFANLLPPRLRRFVPWCPTRCPNFCVPRLLSDAFVPKNFRPLFKFQQCLPKACFRRRMIATRICIPRYLDHAISHISKQLSPQYKGVTELPGLVPRCKTCEHPCIPPYIKLQNAGSVGAPLSRVLPTCKNMFPAKCAGQVEKAICIPPQFARLRKLIPPKAQPMLQVCPNTCTSPCLPHKVIDLLAPNTAKRVLRMVEDCSDSKCKKFTRKLCVPRHYRHMIRHVPTVGPYVSLLPLCGKCQGMCLPQYLRLHPAMAIKAGLPLSKINKVLPPCKICTPKGKPRMCVPAPLTRLVGKFPKPVRMLLPHCKGKCPNLCIPDEIKNALNPKYRQLLHVPDCYGRQCSLKKSHKRRFCFPKFFAPMLARVKKFMGKKFSVKLFKHFPKCSGCTRMCLPPWISLSALHKKHKKLSQHINMNKILPKCKRPASCKKKKLTRRTICLPRQFASLKKALPKQVRRFVPMCGPCPNLCFPKIMTPLIPKEVRPFIKFPSCHQKCAPSAIRHDLCAPKYLEDALQHVTNVLPKKYDAASILVSIFPRCKRCQRPCLPSFLDLSRAKNKLAQVVGKVVPTCPKPKSCKTVKQSLCLPKRWQISRLVRSVPKLANLTKAMPDCKPCHEPCLPSIVDKMASGHKKAEQALKFIRRCEPHKGCKGKLKLAPCIPTSLQHIIEKNKPVFNVLFDKCKPCEAMCVPPSIKTAQLGAIGKLLGATVPKCPQTASEPSTVPVPTPAPPGTSGGKKEGGNGDANGDGNGNGNGNGDGNGDGSDGGAGSNGNNPEAQAQTGAGATKTASKPLPFGAGGRISLPGAGSIPGEIDPNTLPGMTNKLAVDPLVIAKAKTVNNAFKNAHKKFVAKHAEDCKGKACPLGH